MNRLSTLVVAASLTLAAVALGVSPSLAQPVTSLETAALVPAVAQAQSGADREVADGLPQDLARVVDRSSVRVLAENSVGTYSVAMNTSGQEVCVISQMKNALEVTGASCARKEKFAQDGVSVSLQGNSLTAGTSSVYLLPRGVEAGPLRAHVASAGGPLTGEGVEHVIVQTGADSLPEQMELKRSNSEVKFVFQKLQIARR